MQNLGVKNHWLWNKISISLKEILTEESVLNYPVSELAESFMLRLKKGNGYLERYWKKLENCNWYEELEELEKYAKKEPFSRITVLAAANILVFIWMAGIGSFNKIFPDHLNIYMASALGAETDEASAEIDEAGFFQGLEIQNDSILEPKADPENNSISEAKCEKDKERGKCSDLCADFDLEQDLISQMREEEIRMHEKENARNAFFRKKATTAVRRGPIPYVFAMKDGRRVCNRKNDHPSKSKQNKKGHMDMECCLDPDETPNPNCYYSPEKYGKYL